jgi:hypothetical protein
MRKVSTLAGRDVFIRLKANAGSSRSFGES